MEADVRCSYIIRHVNEWYTSPVANPSDSALAAYVVGLMC